MIYLSSLTWLVTMINDKRYWKLAQAFPESKNAADFLTWIFDMSSWIEIGCVGSSWKSKMVNMLFRWCGNNYCHWQLISVNACMHIENCGSMVKKGVWFLSFSGTRYTHKFTPFSCNIRSDIRGNFGSQWSNLVSVLKKGFCYKTETKVLSVGIWGTF